jgi:hypothetical protein
MTATAIIWIIIPVLYISGAVALMPAFSRYRFKVNRAEYSSFSDNRIKNMSVAEAVGVSLVWPICFFYLIGRFSLDKEDNRKAELDEQERVMSLAERRLALQKASIDFKKSHEEAQWLQKYNELDRKASKS